MISRRCLHALVALTMSAASFVVFANPAEIVYYDIVGDSAKQLRHELDTKGPIDDGGKRVDGHTKWYVAWNFRYAPSSGGCAFTQFEVTVKGTVTLPRWVGSKRSSNSLSRKWQSYIAALRLHEDGHYAHGVQAAQDITALGQSFRVSDSCSTIAKTFNDRANAILEQYKAADAAYDSDTKHGEKQGAIFP
jgi:predicted secreted Zn-dependent protease